MTFSVILFICARVVCHLRPQAIQGEGGAGFLACKNFFWPIASGRIFFDYSRLVFACFGDFGSCFAFYVLYSANYPCRIKMGGRPISIGGSGVILPRKI